MSQFSTNISEWMSFLPPLSELTPDERWMLEAFKESLKAYSQGEVPVGAVIVRDGRVVARGYNQVELLQDATAHAEMLAIGAASNFLGGWRLEKCTLYTTLEPCIMCAGATILSRVEKVVWGAPDIRHGAHGSLIDVFSIEHPIHRCQVVKGVLQGVCSEIMRSFFRKRRQTQDEGLLE